VLLQHFWLGLSKESALQLDITARGSFTGLRKESALQLDITAGGSFTHRTTEEGEALLDRILENTPPLELLRLEPIPSHEEVSLAEAEPTLSIQEPSPELEDSEEGLQLVDIPPFEDDPFRDFRNTSRYTCQKRPPAPITPLDPLYKEILKENIKELTAIMSSEWVEEVEHSSREIQIHTPFTYSMQNLWNMGGSTLQPHCRSKSNVCNFLTHLLRS
jgi:hypothetical protein